MIGLKILHTQGVPWHRCSSSGKYSVTVWVVGRMYQLSWVVTALVLRSYQSQSFFFNYTKNHSNITSGSLRSRNTDSEGSTNACPGVEGCVNCIQVYTRSVCLQCLSPLWLWDGRCTDQCPVGMWVIFCLLGWLEIFSTSVGLRETRWQRCITRSCNKNRHLCWLQIVWKGFGKPNLCTYVKFTF